MLDGGRDEACSRVIRDVLSSNWDHFVEKAGSLLTYNDWVDTWFAKGQICAKCSRGLKRGLRDHSEGHLG